MTKKEKKRLREISDMIEDARAEISILIMEEQTRLDSIGDGYSQISRAIKLEEEIDNLEDTEESLDDAVTSIEQII